MTPQPLGGYRAAPAANGWAKVVDATDNGISLEMGCGRGGRRMGRPGTWDLDGGADGVGASGHAQRVGMGRSARPEAAVRAAVGSQADSGGVHGDSARA